MTATSDSAEPAAKAEVTPATDVAVERSVEVSPLADPGRTTTLADMRGLQDAFKLSNADRFLPKFDGVPPLTALRGVGQVDRAEPVRLAQVAGEVQNDGAPVGLTRQENLSSLDHADRTRLVRGPSANRFNEKYGVDVSERVGKDGKKTYEYTYKANGQPETFKLSKEASEATPEGMRKAEQEIQRQVMARMRAMEDAFGVKIPGPGEDIRRQVNTCTGAPGEMIRTRLPTMEELSGLQDALEKGGDAVKLRPDGKPLNIYFGDKPLAPLTGGGDHIAMLHMTEGKGLFVSSAVRNQVPPTDADLTPQQKALKADSLSSMFLHEFGHETHSRVDFQVTPDFLESVGLKRVNDVFQPGKFKEAVKTQDGKLYVFQPALGELCNSKAGGQWYQVNSDGKFIDAKGKPVDLKSASELSRFASLTSDQLLKKAANPPSSNYFESSAEIIAEGLKAFRRNSDSRSDLFRSNRPLHDLVKTLDQMDIDRSHKDRPYYRNSYTNRVEPKF